MPFESRFPLPSVIDTNPNRFSAGEPQQQTGVIQGINLKYLPDRKMTAIAATPVPSSKNQSIGVEPYPRMEQRWLLECKPADENGLFRFTKGHDDDLAREPC